MVVLGLTLIVTFTEGITRWVQSWSQELTNLPPKEETAWDSSALRSFSKHEEHTLKFSTSTLTEHNTHIYALSLSSMCTAILTAVPTYLALWRCG